MTKCHLGDRITWPAPERSEAEGKALTFRFLSEYSAAVHVDIIHALSLAAVEDDPESNFKLKKATVVKPKLQVDEFMRIRAPIRNLVSNVGYWNLACNSRTDVFDSHTCFNNVKHRKPAHFPSIVEWERHAVKCYDHKRETFSRRK